MRLVRPAPQLNHCHAKLEPFKKDSRRSFFYFSMRTLACILSARFAPRPMPATYIHTKSLRLIPQTLEEVRAMVETMSAEDKAQLSADWLAQLHAATSADPWVLGFVLVHRESDIIVGKVGFKGPPAADGMVEIAYCVEPDHEGQGYATEAAQALVVYAFGSGQVRVVRAHTLPKPNASARVLTKCGFRHLGEVIDPDDGPVWRWEKDNASV
jgi:RimJ/RimL family protein N-acetyltransferase